MLSVGTLVAGLRLDKGSFDDDIDKSERGFGDLATAANATGAAMAAAGAAAEGYARSQADNNRVLARTEIATGLATAELRDMAFEMSNATFAASDAAAGMEMLVQKGFDTEEQFRSILPAVDDFADATGKDFPEAIQSADRMLLPFGQSLEDVADQGDHLTRMINQTDIRMGTFERNMGRVPEELQSLEFGFHDAAAGIEVFRDRGFSAEESVREFRRAVQASEGDFDRLMSNIGLTADEWNGYLEAVEPTPGLMTETAQANNDAATPMQNLTQVVENLAFKYGGLADALGTLSPILMGGGGAIVALNQASQMMGRIAESGGRAASAVQGLRAAMGPLAVATLVAADAVIHYRGTLADLRAETEESERTFAEFNDEVVNGEVTWDSAKNEFLEFMLPWRGAAAGFAEAQHGLELWSSEADAAAKEAAGLTGDVIELTDAERSARQHIEAATDAAERHEMGLLGAGDAAEEATEEVRLLNDIMRDFAGGALDADRAAINLQEALESVGDAGDNAGGGIDISTEAGRANRTAVMRATEALWADVDARIEQGASVEEASAITRDHIDALKEEMRQAGLTEDEIQELIAQYKLTPAQITTRINLDDRASSELGRIQGQMDRLPRSFNIRGNVTGMTSQQLQGIGLREHGGSTQPGVPYIVGERRPEVFVPDVPGSIVPSVGQFARGGDGASAGGGGDTHYTLQVTSDASPDALFREFTWQTKVGGMADAS